MARRKAADKTEKPPPRPPGRPPIIRGTEWQPQFDRLIAAGWSVPAMVLYMRTRFGYEVGEHTLQVYVRAERTRIHAEYPELVAGQGVRVFVEAHNRKDALVDVLGELAEMIHLQRERLEIDLKLERESFQKLLPDTRHEIKMMADLLGQYHAMLQDYGVAPRSGVDLHLVPELQGQGDVIDLPVELDADATEAAIEYARNVNRVLST